MIEELSVYPIIIIAVTIYMWIAVSFEEIPSLPLCKQPIKDEIKK